MPIQPLQPIPITNRSQTISFFDPNYTAPYLQNLTLSVTRSVRQNLTVDLRYIGTLARKQFSTIDLNSPNFLYNGLGTDYAGVATSLNTLDYFKIGCPGAGANGNCNLPDVNTSVVKGAVLRFNGFPENFISTNPQFSGPIPGFFGTTNGVSYLSNSGNSNYHSFQAEVTLRATHGFSGSANYTWSKDLGVPATSQQRLVALLPHSPTLSIATPTIQL